MISPEVKHLVLLVKVAVERLLLVEVFCGFDRRTTGGVRVAIPRDGYEDAARRGESRALLPLKKFRGGAAAQKGFYRLTLGNCDADAPAAAWRLWLAVAYAYAFTAAAQTFVRFRVRLVVRRVDFLHCIHASPQKLALPSARPTVPRECTGPPWQYCIVLYCIVL